MNDLSVTTLHIGEAQTTVASSAGTEPGAMIALEIGSHQTASDWFKHTPPTPGELENAIMAVEDEVARARSVVAESTALFTNDAAVREIALIAGLADQAVMVLPLDTVESTFDRLVAISLGRPATLDGLPERPEFAATLLILREFMHHMRFSSITVAAS